MILLSILIPSIPERMDQLKTVVSVYQEQIDRKGMAEHVEIVSLIDNKKISIGEKRNNLISLSRGKYWVMSDDDDSLTEHYFAFIASAMFTEADVITYLQSARINEDRSTV